MTRDEGSAGKPPSHFDLEAVRKNWQRAITPDDSGIPPKVASVETPMDPFVVARANVARSKTLARQMLPSRFETMEPFFSRVEQILDRMEASANAADVAEKTEPADDPAALREELDLALHDIEDLLEVFLGIGR
jgi:hypothetical protein